MADTECDWIAVDWGSTQLRAWAMTAAGDALAARTSSDGCGGLTPDAFEPALIAVIGDWLHADKQTNVLICGMAGSRQGWREAPYLELPGRLSAIESVVPPVQDKRMSVRILGGVCQRAPADVMRGEETQIAGFLSETPGFSGLVCLPGTHTKWVKIESDTLVHSATVMTGEMFALLSNTSVLRHSVATDDWDAIGFDAGIKAALANPAAVISSLFAIRAESLLAATPPAEAKARLSGLLVGGEIAAQRAAIGDGPVHIVGGGGLTALYARGLDIAGVAAITHDGDTLTLKGLRAAHAQISKETR